MPTQPSSTQPRVVIIGCGFGGPEAARALRGAAAVQITLVDRTNHHLLQPLLYQVATAGLAAPAIAAPIRHLFRNQVNVTTLLAEVEGITPAQRSVQLRAGTALPYDRLILAAGAKHSYFGRDDAERQRVPPYSSYCGKGKIMASLASLKNIVSTTLIALAGVLVTSCGGGGGGSVDGGGGGSSTAYTVSVTVSGLAGTGLTLQNNGSDTLAISANGAATFATRVNVGSSYAVTVSAAPVSPGQACAVDNGNGAVGTSNVSNITVTCRNVARSVYVANFASNDISQYNVGANGQLTPMVPATVLTGLNPVGIALDPSGRFAYVAKDDGVVWQFNVAADGRLSLMSPHNIMLAGINPTAIAVDPSGRFVYVPNDGGDVSVYAIGSGGALTPVPPRAIAGTGPSGLAVAPSGRFVYVANDDNTVSQYAIAVNGSLTALTPASVLAGLNPSGVKVDPSGRYAYVTNANGDSVSQYSIAANGGLVALPSPTVLTGILPVSMAIEPRGLNAYVANFTGFTISQYSIAAGGGLSPLSASTVLAGGNPTSVVADPNGRYVYVTVLGNSISSFTIGADGTLTATGVPVATGTAPASIAVR